MSDLDNSWFRSACVIIFGLTICCAPGVFGQGCSIIGQTGQLVDIYDVSLSTETEVIETFQMENAIEIDNAFNEGMDETYITASLTNDILVIHKTDKFGDYAKNEAETSINLKVQFRCQSGTTTGLSTYYTFGIYLTVTNDNAPTFPQSEYNMILPLPLPANFEITVYGEIFARDIDLGDQRVTFAGGNNYFEVASIGRSSTSPKDYYLSIKTSRQILLLPPEAATFQLTATDAGGLTGGATIKIDVDPENNYSRDPSPTFEKSFYNFRIDENGNYYTDYCLLTEDSFEESEVTFSLVGADADRLIISETEGRQVTILFSGQYDKEEYADKTYLIVELLATRGGYDQGHATILVDLPVVCETETTTPPPCEITNCPDADGPVFSKKLYTYRIYAGTLGVIGQVEASIDDPELLPSLRYRLNYNEDETEWLASVVTVDEISGSVTITADSLPQNTFNIEVIATVEDVDTTKVGTARIVVAVDENEKCLESPVEKTLTFVTIKEEEKHVDIFPMTIGECEYELLSFLPNDKEYLIVDENGKLSAIEIDRESEAFGMMTVAQIQAKLKLVCPSGNLLRKRRAIDDFSDNIFTDEIPFHSDITQVNIFIEDINDNAPVFEFPLSSHIGYPDADLVALLLPPYLIKVEASDADEGVHAQIQYSLNANDNFGIDVKSGIIFPLTKELEASPLSLVVSASDAVHVTTLELQVHKVTLDHLIVVYVENYGYHEVEEVTKHLETELGQSLHILKYANVPVNYVKRSLAARSTTGTNLKLVTYAFDEQNQLIPAEDLLKKIEQIEGTASFSLSTVKLEDEMTVVIDKEDEDEPSNSTFVAVIIALSVLVLLLLGAGFVGWWFWIRPTEWKHIEETNSVENVQIERATLDVATTGKSTEEMMERERPSISLNGHTWTESNDNAPQILKNITNIEEGDQPVATEPTASVRERKKSITFNESVERIEIETEVPVSASTYQF